VVNGGSTNYVCTSKIWGDVILPPFGFLVESPTFVAFQALNWNGLSYDSPVLFTLRSQDKIPLSGSHQIRVYHAFGDDKIRVGRQTQTVTGEKIIE